LRRVNSNHIPDGTGGHLRRALTGDLDSLLVVVDGVVALRTALVGPRSIKKSSSLLPA
jgi:hypothetical protein